MKRNVFMRVLEVWSDLEVAAVVLLFGAGLALAPIFEVRRLWNLEQQWLAFGMAAGYAISIAVTVARRRRGKLGNWGVLGWILLSSLVVLVLGESLGRALTQSGSYRGDKRSPRRLRASSQPGGLSRVSAMQAVRGG